MNESGYLLFSGSDEPQEYIEWEDDKDEFFKWGHLSEEKKVKYAHMHLRGSAEAYWWDIRDRLRYEWPEYEVNWKYMRSQLRAKYLGRSYEEELLDSWCNLRQGFRPVIEYVKDFEWYALKCRTRESKAMVISRFRSGLRPAVASRVHLRDIHDLKQAFQVVLNIEWSLGYTHSNTSDLKPTATSLSQVQIAPTPRVSPAPVAKPSPMLPPTKPMDQFRINPGATTQSLTQTLAQLSSQVLSKPDQIPTIIAPKAEPKEMEQVVVPHRSSMPQVTCFRCHKHGHRAGQCTSSTRTIEEPKEKSLEPVSECVEEIYEPDLDLINAYEEEEEYEVGEVSQELPIEEVLEQVPVEPSQEVNLSFEDSPKDLPIDFPPFRSNQLTLEFIPVEHNIGFKVILGTRSFLQSFPKLPQDFNFYFLPFPEPSHISRAIGLHFIEITRLLDPVEPVPFAIYFWHTLWHLLGTHCDFSCTCQTRVKPREPTAW